MTPVTIPALGESISSGILAIWHVADGDYVEQEQLLFELETDKITQELQAEVAGVIRLKVDEGDEVEVGSTVAEIDESASAPSGGSANEAPSATQEQPQAGGKQPQLQGTGPCSDASDAEAHPAQSPAVRRLVAETGIDPSGLQGSGKDGRLTKGDLLAAQQKQSNGQADATEARAAAQKRPATEPSSSVEAAQQGAPAQQARTTRQKMNPLRRKIAERLVQATTEAALLTTFNEVDMSAVMQLRKTHQEAFVQRHGIKLGFMSFFVKATVEALKSVPAINAQIDGDSIIQNHFYDIGVAVGSDKGLMVPVIRDCDRLGFAEIEQGIVDKAQAARNGKLTLPDLSGGVFTISNGGIYGSMLSTPLLNMPQSGILGLHNITERPVAINGEVVIRPMMYLALSYDHRLVDGKQAVTFLVKIKQLIEDPSRLLFGI
jgi:2-oxoglutarate dehydrogenase E2 component (dihydrolipoamide succinyltransferase)